MSIPNIQKREKLPTKPSGALIQVWEVYQCESKAHIHLAGKVPKSKSTIAIPREISRAHFTHTCVHIQSSSSTSLHSQTRSTLHFQLTHSLTVTISCVVKQSGTRAKMEAKKGGDGGVMDLWFSSNPSKKWGEIFFLLYTPFWMTLCLGIIVPYKLYERFSELEYLLLGLISAVPSILIPIIFAGKFDRSICWRDRYWVKASLWIMIFSYVGNYFWTHYFFTVLGASYTFPSWKMNNVPHTTFLLAHVCFLFYHVVSNITLRRLRHSVVDLPESIRFSIEASWILALSYIFAYLETVAIANFPYYDFVDRAAMYTVGCLFYAIYFIVSFPMFLRIDENPSQVQWNLSRVAIDSLGAAMLVTIILDLWRIFLGPIVPIAVSETCIQSGLTWFS